MSSFPLFRLQSLATLPNVTAKDFRNYFRLVNRTTPEANAFRRRMGRVLGFPANVTPTWNAIRLQAGFAPFQSNYNTFTARLLGTGGRGHRNARGATRWPGGNPYTYFSGPVVQRRHNASPYASIFRAAPQLRTRAGMIALGLSLPPHNASGPQGRIPLNRNMAKKIAELVRMLELENLRRSPRTPAPRTLRALPAAPARTTPSPPRRRSARTRSASVKK
jgi:hypothetical protein